MVDQTLKDAFYERKRNGPEQLRKTGAPWRRYLTNEQIRHLKKDGNNSLARVAALAERQKEMVDLMAKVSDRQVLCMECRVIFDTLRAAGYEIADPYWNGPYDNEPLIQEEEEPEQPTRLIDT